jgi:hypothetical protein
MQSLSIYVAENTVLKFALELLALIFRTREVSVQTSTRTPAILTKVFRGLPHSHQINVAIAP